MNADPPLCIDGVRADTRIWQVDQARRTIAGFCVIFDAPGPGISWDAATEFTWHEAGVPVTLCHEGAGGGYGGERVWLGGATLSRHEKIGIMAIVFLPKLMPAYAPTLAVIAQRPEDWAFSIEPGAATFKDDSPHTLSVNIQAIGFARWDCVASTHYTRKPDEPPAHFRNVPADTVPGHCCMIHSPGCWFKPGRVPVWAGK